MDNQATPNLPSQQKGGKTDVQNERDFATVSEAKKFYAEAKQRFLNVNNWHELAGILSADFQLVDQQGKEVQRPAQVDDYFKIDIPGPGSSAGKGYDWVQIEEVEEKLDDDADAESIRITVRPVSNPTTADEDVAHFFSNDATSNFVLMRAGNVVTGGVHGRNEIPNVKAEKVIDKTRNAIIGSTALVGLSDAHWKSLVNGWLEKK